jgi:beta-galactosidase
MRLRDNDPQFLGHVARWFDRILPIIRQFQLGAQGTVIAVQIENELDFYNCGDPAGYMAALRDLARQHGIQVPLIACAGQGDIPRATGMAAGVVPACNFYPTDRDLNIEAIVEPYYAALSAHDLPLLVTETNRAHTTLRRLLSCGAKLIGPYLQASGTNFGFTNAINNWGDPLALLASDYDFGGMIGPAGESRAEVLEAQLLSKVISALGPALARAIPAHDHGITIETSLPIVEGGPRALALRGGGLLLALPHLGDAAAQVRVKHGDTTFPFYTACTVKPNRCPFLPIEVPLSHWRLDGTLAYATAELCLARVFEGCTVLVFHTEAEAEAAFVFREAATVETRAMTAFEEDNRITLGFDQHRIATATIRLAGGATLRVLTLDRRLAGPLADVAADGTPVFIQERAASLAPTTIPRISWSAVDLPKPAAPLVEEVRALGAQPRFLEEIGIARGFGWYGAQLDLPAAEHVGGLLLHDASDIVSVYWDGVYQGTVTPGGGSAYLPRRPGDAGVSNNLGVRTEIWGHSNFDDARLPAPACRRLDSIR